jgi:hypothetical protein
VIKDFVVIVVVDKEYFLLPFDESWCSSLRIVNG